MDLNKYQIKLKEIPKEFRPSLSGHIGAGVIKINKIDGVESISMFDYAHFLVNQEEYWKKRAL